MGRKTIIMNLTQKLRHMEELQYRQAEEMKKFVKRDAATIRSHKNEIRRLKKENKVLLQNEEQLKLEIKKANDIKNEIENELAMKKWEHQKYGKQKNEKLKS